MSLIVTATMSFGFIMISRVPVGRIVLTLVWLFHIAYFVFFVKIIPSEKRPVCLGLGRSGNAMLRERISDFCSK